MSGPAQQPQPVRPSMLRDIFVQAVGSALGVGLVAVVGIAYGFIQVPDVQSWALPAISLLGLIVGFGGVLWVLQDVDSVPQNQQLRKHLQAFGFSVVWILSIAVPGMLLER